MLKYKMLDGGDRPSSPQSPDSGRGGFSSPVGGLQEVNDKTRPYEVHTAPTMVQISNPGDGQSHLAANVRR
jgi:hypothetical protein